MGGALRLHVFLGPTPGDVSRQLSLSHVGIPRVPPRWAMGYHLCRRAATYLAFNLSTEAMWDTPYDSDCVDERLATFAFELDDRETMNLELALEELAVRGKRLMLHLPPQTRVGSGPYQDCQNCYVKFNLTAEMTGQN